MKPLRILFLAAAALLASLGCICRADGEDAVAQASRLTSRAVFQHRIQFASKDAPSVEETRLLSRICDNALGEQSVWQQWDSFEGYIAAFPGSGWTPSLRANLAVEYRRRGRYAKALTHFEEAWKAVRTFQELAGAKEVGDQILGNWTDLLAALGRAEDLAKIHDEVGSRSLDRGALQTRLDASLEILQRLTTDPEGGYRCGVVALSELIAAAAKEDSAVLGRIRPVLGTRQGLSAADLLDLGNSNGIAMVAKEIADFDQIPVPSILHYKVGHFVTILKHEGKRYLVADPANRQRRWVNGAILAEECSGVVLTRGEPSDFQSVSIKQETLKGMIGRGYPTSLVDDNDTYQGMSGGPGVVNWRISEPYLNLWAQANVVTYPLPGGMTQTMNIDYKQRNSRPVSYVFNFGPGWESNWLSFIVYDDEYDDGTGKYIHNIDAVYSPLGGVDLYDFQNGGITYFNQSTIVEPPETGSTLENFTNNLANGSRLIYQANQTFANHVHRNYLKYFIDPQGRTTTFYYNTATNGSFLLTSVVDFSGRTTTLNYSGLQPDQVSSVVDPFGTTTSFVYDSTNHLLTQIVNPISMVSTNQYDSSGAITNISNVYGSTQFSYTVDGTAGNTVNRSMMIVPRPGETNLYAYRHQSKYLFTNSSTVLLPGSYNSSELPSTGSVTNTFENSWMDARNSFYWTPQTYSKLSTSFRAGGGWGTLTTNDYNLARLRHWLQFGPLSFNPSGTLSMQRDPSPDGTTLGHKTWFDYWGKQALLETNGATVTTNWNATGTSALPRLVAGILPDSTTQFTYTEYNANGLPTKVTSTYSVTDGATVQLRSNNYVYAGNNIDLLEVHNASNVITSKNIWNGIHQVITNYNALNEATTTFYQSTPPFLPTGTISTTGIASTNYYWASGMTNFLQSSGIPSFGITHSYTYYTNGLVSTHTDERGVVYTYTYDGLSRKLSEARSDGTIYWKYINLSLASVVDRIGVTNSYAYDAYGRKTGVTNGRLNVTLTGYYPWGGVMSSTNALQQVAKYNYDNLGRLLSTIQDNQRGSTNVYDSVGRVTATIDAAGFQTSIAYNNQGQVTRRHNSAGNLSKITVDILDQVISATDAAGVVTTTSFDALGRVTTQTYPNNLGTTNQYVLGVRAPTNVIDQLGRAQQIGYDGLGRVVATTNANSEINQKQYGVSGEVLSLTDGRNKTTSFAYDAFGRQTFRTNANGVLVLAFQYDCRNQLTNRWSVAKGSTTYRYDQNGNLTNTVYPTLSPVVLQYDALDRITNRVDNLGSTAYVFNNLGELAVEDGPWANDTITYQYAYNHSLNSFSIAGPGGAQWIQSYSYDGVGRRSTYTSAAGTFVLLYDGGLNGNTSSSPLVRSQLLPGGAFTTNLFDINGRMSSTALMNGSGGILDSHVYTYDAANEATNVVRYDGSILGYGYDAIGQIVSAGAKETNGTIRIHEQFGYAYDQGNNLTNRVSNALVQGFGVDSLNQLTSAARTGTLTVSGTSSGSASSVTVNGATANRYLDNTFALGGFSPTNGVNSYKAIAQDAGGRAATNTVTVNAPSSIGYSYDLNGNMTSDGGLTYDFDDENRLFRITATAAWKSEFVYDGLGQLRIRTEYVWRSGSWAVSATTKYVLVGGIVIQERDVLGTPLVSYTRTSGLGGGIGGLLARTDHASGTHCYYHSDISGNVSSLVNGQQAVVGRYLYDPYGNLISSAGTIASQNTLRYASKELHQASGLIHFGGRFYNPRLHRWQSQDPSLEAGGVNLHRYTSGNPIGRLDPWGYSEEYGSWGAMFNTQHYNPFDDYNRPIDTGWIAVFGIGRSQSGWVPGNMDSIRVFNTDDWGALTGAVGSYIAAQVRNQEMASQYLLTDSAPKFMRKPDNSGSTYSDLFTFGYDTLGIIGSAAKSIASSFLENPPGISEARLASNEVLFAQQAGLSWEGLGHAGLAAAAIVTGVADLALIEYTATARVVGGVATATVAGETMLYRAVGPAELADIQANNVFRNLGSAEGKYFTTSAEDASFYAKQAVVGFKDPPYTIIQTRVPNSIFDGLLSAPVDRGIPAWVIPNARLNGLIPEVLPSMPIPRP